MKIKDANLKWRPISTAPIKERKPIWLKVPGREPQAAYSDTFWISGFSVECKPTHWKPRTEPTNGQARNQFEIVFMEWVDSTTTFGWHEPDKNGPSVITSVGILVYHDEKNVVISTSKGSSGCCIDQLTIPRSCIQKMQRRIVEEI